MNIHRIIPTLAIAAAAALTANAQAVWNRAHIDSVRTQLHRPTYAAAFRALAADADSIAALAPLSVMDKQQAGASGDKHDYTSLARYFHPNPDTPDGLPYVNRDGITNPEIARWDRNRLGDMASRVADLSLAWYLGGDTRHAEAAARQLRTWFIDPATRMNPHFRYAQMVPGVDGGNGRPFGVLDGYSFVTMLEGVALLQGSPAWTPADDAALRAWMGELLDWLLTSPQGRAEAEMANNHSTACDAQLLAIALYTGRTDVAEAIVDNFPARRIFAQIEPDGMQPAEMWRTLSYGYSAYNLTHMADVFVLARRMGRTIDRATSPDGRSFYRALDLLASMLGKDASAWPGQQISGWHDKQQEVARELYRAATLLDTARTDYRALFHRYGHLNPTSRFALQQYAPDYVDDAYTLAAASLRRGIEATRAARQGRPEAAHYNPRTVRPDGTLAIVHPHDWTSGFFPGELWMMYEYTGDPYWRREADAFTRDIEMAKRHGGTHDLGFMIGDSFGKAWEITGDSAYLDVTAEAARTLCTRFRPAVGAIRSWDHNADRWQCPVIIDNMMNLEMLFKMAEATADSTMRAIAVSHADVTLRNHFRPDATSYHVVDYDPATGAVRMRVTAQGYADESIWSRGQAWGLYGYTMCHRFTADPRYLAHATAIADMWLALPNMPADRIPYWDMLAPGTDRPDNPDVPRDASAAAIIASGLYELAGYVDTDRAARYRAYADSILHSLSTAYTLAPDAAHGFILAHSTGHHPGNSEIDVPLIYADYYYLEALRRSRK